MKRRLLLIGSNRDLEALRAAALRRERYRVYEFVDDELRLRAEDREIPHDEPHDYLEEQILYNRHDPRSPWAF